MNGFTETVWELSRCAAEGCEAEGTEELHDTYFCPSCYVSRMTHHTNLEDSDG